MRRLMRPSKRVGTCRRTGRYDDAPSRLVNCGTKSGPKSARPWRPRSSRARPFVVADQRVAHAEEPALLGGFSRCLADRTDRRLECVKFAWRALLHRRGRVGDHACQSVTILRHLAHRLECAFSEAATKAAASTEPVGAVLAASSRAAWAALISFIVSNGPSRSELDTASKAATGAAATLLQSAP